MRHPRAMRGAEFNAFLSRLTTQEQVSASTQNQAVSALLFLTASLLVGMWGTGGKDRRPQASSSSMQVSCEKSSMATWTRS
ncbi:MAG: phage integrase N-terminal SAM-like domain-containing protein [Synechococcus sp.]